MFRRGPAQHKAQGVMPTLKVVPGMEGRTVAMYLLVLATTEQETAVLEARAGT